MPKPCSGDFKKSTNIDALNGELGLLPMSIQRKIILIKYWSKILQSKEDSLLHQSYNILKDMPDNVSQNKANWTYNIKVTLEECGLNQIWLNHQTEPINTRDETIWRYIDTVAQRYDLDINFVIRRSHHVVFIFCI